MCGPHRLPAYPTWLYRKIEKLDEGTADTRYIPITLEQVPSQLDMPGSAVQRQPVRLMVLGTTRPAGL